MLDNLGLGAHGDPSLTHFCDSAHVVSVYAGAKEWLLVLLALLVTVSGC